MLGFAKIAGGTPSIAAAMTDHLQNQTLTPEQASLAAYYAKGGGSLEDSGIEASAELVADGTLTHSQALDLLVAEWRSKPSSKIERLEEIQVRLGKRLETAVARLQDDQPPEVSIAVLRQDIHPLALRGLGLDQDEALTRELINGLLAGRRADGELIKNKRYAVAHDLPPNPRTGELRDSAPIGSYDFCPTPDKTISVAWAFAEPVEQAMIFNAHIEAAREAVAYIAGEVGQARLGAGGEDGREPGHVGWIEFTHHTSRRTQGTVTDGVVSFGPEKSGIVGDPDLHTHFLMPNAVFCASGRIGSLDTKAVGGFIFEADAYYHATLGQKLRDAGFATALDHRTGAVRMPIVPDDVRVLFSKRTNQGEALARQNAAKRGEDWAALSPEQQVTRLKNATQDRNQKGRGDKDDVADTADWRRQAGAAGWEPPGSFMAMERTPELQHEARIRLAYEVALPILADKFEQSAVLRHYDVRVAALRGLVHAGMRGLGDIAAVTKIMREEGVLQYGERTGLVWGQEADKRHLSITTALHESQEIEFVRLAKAAGQDRSGALSAKVINAAVVQASGLDFTGDHGKAQLAAIRQLGQGGRFGVAIGTAGSGKSAMLKVLTAAWKEQGREVFGASLAWRQADDMAEGGIDKHNLKAFSVLIDGVRDGSIKLGKHSVVAIDEWGLLGTRQGLELLRLRERHGFSVVALGDEKQCGAIAAGAIIDLSRRALGAEQVPEILTTVRQQTERERQIAGLFRDGLPREALDMKRSDGSAEMVPGGYDQAVARVAQLYVERLGATGDAPTISAPTNADAHQIGEAVRLERRKLGLVGPDLRTVKATDGQREYDLPLAKGDHVRLFRSTGVRLANGRGGRIGRNGSVLEVVNADQDGVVLRSVKNDLVGHARWSDLTDRTGRVSLAYGTALTIHTAQGMTSKEHIFALPAGSQAVTGLTAYVAGTRHRVRSFLVTSDMAEREDVWKSRPLNDTRAIDLDAKWANVARHFVQQPVKDLAVGMVDRVQAVRRGMVRSFHAGLQPAEQRGLRGEPAAYAQEKRLRMQIQRSPVMRQMMDVARDLQQRAVNQVRRIVQQRQAQSHEHRGPSLRM